MDMVVLSERKKCGISVMCLAVKKEQVVESEERVKGTIFPKKAKNLITSEGRDEDEEYGKLICPGCGIFMQDNSPDLPGYYQKRKVTAKNLEVHEEEEDDDDDDDDDDDEDEEQSLATSC